ncbi:uncharacterized protein BP01DRAFT_80116 [Aspergillus saccharolyticus JOP 1030-1]|uniref:Uncharacterized protein n=1 Tax=Aspergillus saccharolyticus JOP 1030-1 TaxID=1450539 RepID=A0A318ZZ24_9EURO|nr:hypothetical protein BP01DRAFT_80116 [Aspergillus saccharolyticus JOP 1030-1]PYH49533.1 hypothetical protein BP01DRAFT_80116 [Aspergillus saccharolyticus JOP 1030-1]
MSFIVSPGSLPLHRHCFIDWFTFECFLGVFGKTLCYLFHEVDMLDAVLYRLDLIIHTVHSFSVLFLVVEFSKCMAGDLNGIEIPIPYPYLVSECTERHSWTPCILTSIPFKAWP